MDLVRNAVIELAGVSGSTERSAQRMVLEAVDFEAGVPQSVFARNVSACPLLL